MTKNELKQATPRRGFLTAVASGATALGLASLMSPFRLDAQQKQQAKSTAMGPEDAWFAKIKGKHRMIFDATEPHDVFPFAWPKVFLLTNAKTGTPENDCSVVVVLRHAAIGYAFESRLWEKYKFGEMFKADDPQTKAPSTRNPFWQPKPGDFKIPGIGEVQIGINELQASGVMFCVCNMAMTVYSAVAAGAMNMQPADVMKEWMGGLLPGIQVVPSGVWAVGRAQEHGCAYCFAG